jgi:NADP-dependent 3-hydroxy acid dehydrogenase YdfG
MAEAQDGAKEGCIVVLGATGGVGSVLARRLAAKGNRLLIAGRNPEKLEALAAEIGAVTLVLDARRAAEVQAGLDKAVERFGRVDGVANCVAPERSWVTGQILGVDGGLGSVRARGGG